MTRVTFLLLGILLFSVQISAQIRSNGSIQGTILDAQSKIPVEYANVALIDTVSGKLISGVVTDSSGSFRLSNISYGVYFIEYSFIGYQKVKSQPISIDRKNYKVDAGKLELLPAVINLQGVTVSAEKNMIVNKIDRKIFNVQQDIMALSGSASDVLQNIPAVAVDMDGNVSLRGSGNVTILVNGRPSAMTGAESLEQMPASLIDRIEVITNPSAKYRPDGTAGIINIILKKNRKAGFNGSLGGNAGNNDRYNGNLQFNLNTGKINIFGSYGLRKDYRWRAGDLNSQTIDTSLHQSTYLRQHSEGYSRPVGNLATLGIDWNISDQDVAGISGTYDYRQFTRISKADNLYSNDSLQPIEEFTRYQDGPDFMANFGANTYYEHTFNKESDHKLRADFAFEYDDEHENYTYSTVYTLPSYPDAGDHNYNHILNEKINLAINYSRPLWKNASMEAGYEGNIASADKDLYVYHLNTETRIWVEDSVLTNHFRGSQTVHALFGTLSYTVKKFSFIAGVRPEFATVNIDYFTSNTRVDKTYFAVYPTLHLSLASGKNEWQLNYSRRVNRPDSEDLNPVPEYRDSRNYFVGNPDLMPEQIHSFELGYAVKSEHVTLIPALFYRYRLNGFTTVTYNQNDSVLITSIENLSHDQSAGIDFSGNAQIKILNLNFSVSGFYNEIDASNLGYSKNKAVMSWNAKLNASVNITKTTILQANGQYRSSVLTPQGIRYPTWVVNLGFRQDFWKKKLSVLFTVSDLFNSNATKSNVNTPVLVQESVRWRDAPVIYGGVIFKFSTNDKNKKEKDIKFEFDNATDR